MNSSVCTTPKFIPALMLLALLCLVVVSPSFATPNSQLDRLANPNSGVALAGPADAARLYAVGDTLFLETPRTLGGLFLVFNGDAHPQLLQSDAGIEYHFDGTQTRALILGDSALSVARLYSGPLLTFPSLTVPVSADASDTAGLVVAITIDSPTGVDDGVKSDLPAKFVLEQNYPNPFNPSTVITFSLARSAEYTLAIYNIAGQEVARFSGTAGPGVVRKQWDGSTHASGVYFYRVTAGSITQTKKMSLVK
jgi:hypothetical protein